MGFPLQLMLVKMMFMQRKKGVVLTDQRVRMTTEVIWFARNVDKCSTLLLSRFCRASVLSSSMLGRLFMHTKLVPYVNANSELSVAWRKIAIRSALRYELKPI